MNGKARKIVMLITVLAIIALFSLFLKDILVPYIKLEIKNDTEGATLLLKEKGVLGFLTVVLVEALQMVVVFIPAEFIQISSGLSYPFYIAILLCDLGVCLGATIIYVLVKVFHVDSEEYEKNRKKIDKLASGGKKERSTVLLLYFLFIMPLIPFGAICYYASGKKLRYGPYIRTVATGVIPSVVTSNLMGTAGKFFIRNELPMPLLILIIALLAGVLFLALFLFLDKVYFKENDGTPESIVYSSFFKVAHFLRRRKQRLHVDNEKLKEAEPPYVLLCNHSSFYDFYYVHMLTGDDTPAIVANKYYLELPVVKRLAKKAGFIPKKLFNADFVTSKGIFRAIKEGYPVVIFPEGRLSITGRTYPIIEKGGSFYKKLGADIVIACINGAYMANPKWRKRFYKSDIYVSVKRVIKKEEAASLSASELNELIDGHIYHDEMAEPVNRYDHRDMAEGLENVIYRCPSCGALYSTKGRGNELCCSACGKAFGINGDYTVADESFRTIADMYEAIERFEKEELDSLDISCEVDTVIYSDKKPRKRRETGTCRLTREGFSYRSDITEFSVGFDVLHALPFSCGKEFELYHDNELCYFYPKQNGIQAARWALIVDIIKEERDGKQKEG